jgi:peroxiredoxin
MKIASLFVVCLFAAACGGADKAIEQPTTPDTMENPQSMTTPANPATAFTLPDMNGDSVSLSDYTGKVVVLEWFNPGCPFVKYAYSKGPLKTMASDYMNKGVVWLTINSGAPGKEGAAMPDNKKAYKNWNMSSTLLFDTSGTVGQSYGAKTTPHMWVINQQGNIVYQGALDNAPMGESKEPYQNYTQMALDAVLAGQPVQNSMTTSYGCSVKYGN